MRSRDELAMGGVLAIGLVLAGLGILSGCSSDDKDAASNGAAASATNGSGAGGTAGSTSPTTGAGGTATLSTSAGVTSTTGPAISSAPAAWQRPAECQGVGNRCPNLSGCEEGSVCQAIGDVCVPYAGDGQLFPGKSAERPYCAAYTCMTFGEASCFCTGDAAVTEPDCRSPEALAGLCVGEDQGCNTSACCQGLSCVLVATTSKRCAVPCASNDDCESGCCTDLYDTGDLICADQEACDNPCRKRGESCEAGDTSTPNNCCRGACVDSTNPDYAGCRPRCTTNDDCVETGCCRLFADSTSGFCSDALYCSCGGVGAACGVQGTSDCCEGTHCTSADQGVTFACSADCTSDTDCPGSCCVSVTATDYMICTAPENCP